MKPKTGVQIDYYRTGSTPWTKQELQAIVPLYDRFVTRHAPYVPWIRDIKPEAFILCYRHTTVVYGPPSDWGEFQTFVDNNALLKRADGSYLQHVDYPHEYLVDPANPWYMQWIKEFYDARIAEGYDGIFADLLGWPTYRPPWHYTAPRAINPRTGKEYTNEEYADDHITLCRHLKKDRTYPIIGNGIPQADGGYGYLANPSKADTIIGILDGVMIEGPWGWSESDAKSRGWAKWLQNRDLLRKLNTMPNKIKPLMNHAINNPQFVYCSFWNTLPNDTANTYWKHGGRDTMESEAWKSLIQIDPGEWISEGSEGDWFWANYERYKFSVNPVTLESKIEEVKNELVKYYNEKTVPFTVYKRKIVITDTPITIQPGQSVEIPLTVDEVLVQK